MAWVRHHMERQMLQHIVLDYRAVHRRNGRQAGNRQAVEEGMVGAVGVGEEEA